MPEVFTPPVRIHRVTTRRRTLRVLNCPLEPELLVAEFAGELPPEVTTAVREHIAVCDTCGARSRALRTPYELLSSLGHEPVPQVPDLRDTIRARSHAGRFYRDLLRTTMNLGRGGAIGISGMVGAILVVVLLVSGVVLSVNAHGVSRSQNALSHVPSAAPSGVVFAQTDKLVTVTDSTRTSWEVAEVIVVDQHTGAVLRSLPASEQSLKAAGAGDLPVAAQVSADGSTVFEVTAPTSRQGQALVAFDATTGAVQSVARLTLPDGEPLPAGSQADALALSLDGATAYVGLATPNVDVPGPRVLVVDAASGAVERALSPSLPSSIPTPAPPGSLPVSMFPTVAPQLDTGGMSAALGADGQLVASPDGNWLFDLVLLTSDKTAAYGVIRRINTQTGATEQALAIQGDFRIAALAISGAGAAGAQGVIPTTPAPDLQQPSSEAGAPQLYVIKGSPDAQAFVLDPGVTGPMLVGDIGLGGPAAPATAVFSGSVAASPSADGTRLYVVQSATAEGGQIAGDDVWLLDAQGMTMIAHRLDVRDTAVVLANQASSGRASEFLLSGGVIQLVAPDLGGSVQSWLSLGDGHSVVRLLASVR